MIIVYQGYDEAIVTNDKKETDMLKAYFGPGAGRDINDYYRKIAMDDIALIKVELRTYVD
jgi:hypothetical protein